MEKLLLLELQSRMSSGYSLLAEKWFNCTDEYLTLVPQGRHDAILAVLTVQTDLPQWIEEPDGTFDDVPVYILWDIPNKTEVHKYGPFENGVRPFVHRYERRDIRERKLLADFRASYYSEFIG